jgi:hypothetical protein
VNQGKERGIPKTEKNGGFGIQRTVYVAQEKKAV